MKKAVPLIRRPWFAFLSSMRFAVALLTLLSIASVVGTVLQQNQPIADYVINGTVEEVVPKLIKYYKKNSK